MENKTEFHHYKECGLSNIYLLNGYDTTVIDGQNYISFHEINNLHRTVAKEFIYSNYRMTGEQLYFLREELHWSQQYLAKILQIDTYKIIRWECDKLGIVNDLLVDVMVRELYREHVHSFYFDSMKKLLQKLKSNKFIPKTEFLFSYNAENKNWPWKLFQKETVRGKDL